MTLPASRPTNGRTKPFTSPMRTCQSFLREATMADQILFVRTTRCQGCGALHTTSELFAVDILNPKGRHLAPASLYRPELGLDKVAPETRTTPICHQCADSHAPTLSDRESYSRWQDTLKRKREEERRVAPTRPSAPTNRDTLEDII